MRYFFVFMFLISLFTLSQAGVIKESKTAVNFSGFGKYITETTVKIEGLRKKEESRKEFKGEGFMGGLAEKFILQPGNDAQLLFLDEMKTYTIDHTKKEYVVTPIERIEYGETGTVEEEANETDEAETENEEEGNIRVIRNEFRVNDTGDQKNINNFPCRKFIANWIFEWENIETGERGIDSLETVVWTTKLTDEMQKTQQEELDFNKAYLNKIGIETNAFYEDVLGTKWMEMFSQLSQSRNGYSDENTPEFVNEMQKIEGYPVVTDGNYYFIRKGEPDDQPSVDEPQEEETVKNPRDVKGMFGGLMKKAMKPKDKPAKKKEKGPKSAFSFYNELIRLESQDINQSDIQVPAGYTEVSGAR